MQHVKFLKNYIVIYIYIRTSEHGLSFTSLTVSRGGGGGESNGVINVMLFSKQ